jgi:hypothetical protein
MKVQLIVKRLYVLMALVSLMLLSACEQMAETLRVTCRSMRFSYAITEAVPGGFPSFSVSAYLEATDTLLGSAPIPTTLGSHTVTINFPETYPAGTRIYFVIVVDGLGEEESPGIPCDGVDEAYVPCMVSDGRVNVYHCGSPVAVYCVGEGIDVYGVDPQTGAGEMLIRVSRDAIEAIGIPEGAHATVAEADGVLLSRLTDGKFQLNTHYDEGKPYIIAWAGCPDAGEVEILAW